MQATRLEEAGVFRSVRRSCYAGLDSVTLREELARRVSLLIPFEAHNLATTDPDTGLFTHAVAAGLPASLNRAWLDHYYPFQVAAEIIDMARKGEAVSTSPPSGVMEILGPEGFGHDLRTILAESGNVWGFTCFLRESGSPAFSSREAGFMRRIAPHFTAGLRSAALVDRASLNGRAPGNGSSPRNGTGLGSGSASGSRSALGNGSASGNGSAAGNGSGITGGASAGHDPPPGVLVLDSCGRRRTGNTAAAEYLEDLRDVGRGPEAMPYAVSSAVAQLTHRHAAGAADESMALCGELSVHGRSGRWYTVRASLAEPDASGRSDTIVLIEVAHRAALAVLLTRLYGLTPRERELVALAAKGLSTKQMARQLGISPYTIQEHLGNACEKVGVRTRKALLAKLFFDGYAPRLAAD